MSLNIVHLLGRKLDHEPVWSVTFSETQEWCPACHNHWLDIVTKETASISPHPRIFITVAAHICLVNGWGLSEWDQLITYSFSQLQASRIDFYSTYHQMHTHKHTRHFHAHHALGPLPEFHQSSEGSTQLLYHFTHFIGTQQDNIKHNNSAISRVLFLPED